MFSTGEAILQRLQRECICKEERNKTARKLNEACRWKGPLSSEGEERYIADMLAKYDKTVHPVGDTLSESVCVYRVQVVRTFLRAGVPLGKVDTFRKLLEENAFRLCDSSNLRELIPFVRKQEQVSLVDEVNGKLVSVIFDGTTHVCEALVIILRYNGVFINVLSD